MTIALATSAYMARRSKAKGETGTRAKVSFPWFIVFFILASVAATYLPYFAKTYGSLRHLGEAGLTATLFLIGTSLSKKTLEKVGLRPFLQAIVLWIIVGTASLAAIYTGVIGIR